VQYVLQIILEGMFLFACDAKSALTKNRIWRCYKQDGRKTVLYSDGDYNLDTNQSTKKALKILGRKLPYQGGCGLSGNSLRQIASKVETM